MSVDHFSDLIDSWVSQDGQVGDGEVRFLDKEKYVFKILETMIFYWTSADPRES